MQNSEMSVTLPKRRPGYLYAVGILLANALSLGLNLLVRWPPAQDGILRMPAWAVCGLLFYPVLLLAIYYKTKRSQEAQHHSPTYRVYLLVLGAGSWLFACYSYLSILL